MPRVKTRSSRRRSHRHRTPYVRTFAGQYTPYPIIGPPRPKKGPLSPVPPELLHHVVNYLEAPDLISACRVNTAFYEVAKPRLFREVLLDAHFHLVGPGHAMEDLYDGTRPVFLRSWMSAHTTSLEVA